MIKRVLAWVAVLAGGLITVESVFIAHRPNWVWILIFVIGCAYFVRNGFMKQEPRSPTGAA